MFQDTLLIIKCDYMHKRKQVLLKLLQSEFQILGNRRVLFTPEHAAEFYKHMAEDKCFMLQVILLSKGKAEAFILSKENAVSELMTTMICYFRTSIEMEKNVHVSKSEEHARREIPFIFPNYISEPISSFNTNKFCQAPLLKELINEIYEIMNNNEERYPEQWKAQLAEWLTLSNKALPRVSNQCSHKPLINRDDKTTYASTKAKDPCQEEREATPRSGTCSTSSGGSAMMTTSSCMTCSCFDGDESCLKKPKKVDSGILLFKAKTARSAKSLLSVEEQEEECEDDIEWVEIIEDESLGVGENDEIVKIESGEINVKSETELQQQE